MSIGFEIAVNWPEDIRAGTIKRKSAQVGVLAYADDMTWIARVEKNYKK